MRSHSDIRAQFQGNSPTTAPSDGPQSRRRECRSPHLDGRRVLALTVTLLLHVIGIAWLCLPGTPPRELADQPSTAQRVRERLDVFVALDGMRERATPPPLPEAPRKRAIVREAAAASAPAALSAAPAEATPAVETAPTTNSAAVTESRLPAREPEAARPVDSEVPIRPVPAAAGSPPDRSTRDAYVRALMAALLEHRTYPAAARKARARGVVHVRFSINRQGQVLSSSIASSPGFAVLEQAALEVLRHADPLPRIPDGIANDRLTVTVPIEYTLITR
jgi:periplasmic protein TonB